MIAAEHEEAFVQILVLRHIIALLAGALLRLSCHCRCCCTGRLLTVGRANVALADDKAAHDRARAERDLRDHASARHGEVGEALRRRRPPVLAEANLPGPREH